MLYKRNDQYAAAKKLIDIKVASICNAYVYQILIETAKRACIFVVYDKQWLNPACSATEPS